MSTTFEVIAEPNRRRILELLREQAELAVNDLVDLLGITQPNVSKHLRVLRDAGLVRSRRSAQQRLYRLDPGPLLELDDWLTPFRAVWAERLDALDAHLDTMEDT